MPRKYVRRADPRKYGYAEDAMQRAVMDVNENGVSVKKAAFIHGLIRTTLMHDLKNSSNGQVGHSFSLTVEEESLIVHALQKLGDWGFGLDRPAVQSIVKQYVINVGKVNVFKESKPGIEWMCGFERR